jgi:hypothetical protein
MEQNGNEVYCGNCLMERVEITALRADGSCPVCEPGIYKVRMDKYKATWNYFTTNPQGGGFGSNYCGPKYIALARAIQNIPLGSKYILVVNGKESLEVR